MKKNKIIILLLLIVACNGIENTHIKENVPDSELFNQFIERDLLSYFKNIYDSNIIVDWLLLRKAPTQTGTAFPKFYLWATIYDKSTMLSQGVLSVAAVDKKSFNIIDFIEIDDYWANTNAYINIFPSDIKKRIENLFPMNNVKFSNNNIKNGWINTSIVIDKKSSLNSEVISGFEPESGESFEIHTYYYHVKIKLLEYNKSIYIVVGVDNPEDILDQYPIAIEGQKYNALIDPELLISKGDENYQSFNSTQIYIIN